MAKQPRNIEEAIHNAKAAVNKVPFFSGSMRSSILILIDLLGEVLGANTSAPTQSAAAELAKRVDDIEAKLDDLLSFVKTQEEPSESESESVSAEPPAPTEPPAPPVATEIPPKPPEPQAPDLGNVIGGQDDDI